MMDLGKHFQHLFPCGLPQFDVIENPFCEAIKVRQLLYPTDVCMLNKRHFVCLKHFLMSINEKAFVITDSFRLSNSSGNQFSLFPFDVSFSQLATHAFLPVTVYFSINGTWAIVISDEEYGVAGSVSDYSQEFRKCFRPCLNDCKTFMKEYAVRTDLPNKEYNHWRVQKVLEWIPGTGDGSLSIEQRMVSRPEINALRFDDLSQN